jgi:hypothetical protein
MRALLRRYRTLRSIGVGRIASMRTAWRVEHERMPKGEDWPAC